MERDDLSGAAATKGAPPTGTAQDTPPAQAPLKTSTRRQGAAPLAPSCIIRPLRGIGEQRTYRCLTQPFVAHAHDHYVLGLVEEGSRTLQCNGQDLDLRAGDIIAFNPGDVHSCRQSDGGVFAYDSMAIDAALLDGATLAGPRIRNHEATRLFNEARQAVETLDASALKERVLRLCEFLTVGKAGEAGPHRNAEAAYHALAHFCGHLSNPMTLRELAVREGLSPYALIRAYRNRFSITPMRHLASLRVTCACHLLAEGVAPAVVAAEVGFADQPHLTRAFKQRMGVTPAAYQQMAQAPGTRP